jgi:DNA processing protein
LARRDVTIVSGGAYGIDAAAHRAALAAGGQTVLISAGGLDRPYPPGNAALFDRVAEFGLLVSESPPGCAPQRRRFLTRNRLIAALSTATLVVEAARRSGANNTARHCVTLQRPLLAVPGPITSAMSAGCHELIRRDRDPALLVSSVEDVLAVVGRIGEGLTDPSGAGNGAGADGAGTTTMCDGGLSSSADAARAELDRIDSVSRRVFDGLPARRFARPEEIAVRCGLSPLDVIRALPTLDLAGLVEAGDGGYRIAARLRRRN